MKSAYLTCVLAGIGFIATGCTAIAATDVSTDGKAHRLETRLSQSAGGTKVTCLRDTYGNLSCSGGGYSIEPAGCGPTEFYGRIASAGGVMLEAQLVGKATHPVAHLEENQFVCIEATATMNGQERSFVRAVPVETVPGCKDNALCKKYRNFPIKWAIKHSDEPCHRLSDERYSGDCATGWIDNKSLEDFSMGL